MAFVVEDGTGLPNANSYASVEFADAYFEERINESWTGEVANKQAALILATDYIDGRFGGRFIGKPKTTTQSLQWPRTGTKFEGVPVQLQKACVEYALRALTGPLAPDIETDAGGVVTVQTRRKLGPLEQEFAVVAKGYGSEVELLRPYPSADMYLRGLLYSTGRVIR